VKAAVDHGVPMPAISASLFARFASQQDDSPAMKVVAALRNQFGGHAVTSATAGEPAAPLGGTAPH
jgi:6-phosphogluconate dehydrogenase